MQKWSMFMYHTIVLYTVHCGLWSGGADEHHSCSQSKVEFTPERPADHMTPGGGDAAQKYGPSYFTRKKI